MQVSLPRRPGVYLFRDAAGAIIYVGKARDLNARVRSYFTKGDRSVKTAHLVRRIASIDHIVVANEVEALLLENRLIKQHQPRYNVTLKDAKTYAYLKLTDETYPRLITTRSVTRKGTYFGPYSDGTARARLLRLAIELFQIRTCRRLPKKACLNYHIGLCTAPCIANVTREQYAQQVSGARGFLRGETAPVRARLEREMHEASGREEFELALLRRNQLVAIDHLEQRQRVDRLERHDQHLIAFDDEHIVIIPVRRGTIAGKQQYTSDDAHAFIRLYYSHHPPPREILLERPAWEDAREQRALEAYLAHHRGGPVMLGVPRRGEKRHLVELARRNLAPDPGLAQLAERLHLPRAPSVIECFDISNLGPHEVVAGMTRWSDGREERQGYRRFKIRRAGQDDVGAMHEAVSRRYRHGERLPDLILIDGGPGQLNAALRALAEHGLRIRTIALAKREEEIFRPGTKRPLKVAKQAPMMLLVRRIRDATHTYALAYQKKRREMRARGEWGRSGRA